MYNNLEQVLLKGDQRREADTLFDSYHDTTVLDYDAQ